MKTLKSSGKCFMYSKLVRHTNKVSLSFLLRDTLHEAFFIEYHRVISSIINRNFFVTRNKQPMTIVRWLTRAIQKCKFQYNNIYSSTTISIPVQKKYIPVQQYIFQYTNVFFSATYIPVQILFRYRIINSGTEIYSSTKI